MLFARMVMMGRMMKPLLVPTSMLVRVERTKIDHHHEQILCVLFI
jgi:hypothetical protein